VRTKDSEVFSHFVRIALKTEKHTFIASVRIAEQYFVCPKQKGSTTWSALAAKTDLR
jgi:hypothetical protein